MNYTNENAIEMPTTAVAPVSAIMGETDNILNECLAMLDRLNTSISGMGRVEEKKLEPKCMADAVRITADKAKSVLAGIRQVMEAIGV